MNRYRRRLLIATWLATGGAVYGLSGSAAFGQPAESKSPASSETAVFDPSIPAKLEVTRARTGHMLVRPRVNGREAGWFIFDTGAGICVVSRDQVELLDLERSGEIDTVGVGGSEKAVTYRASALVLGPMRLTNHTLMAVDLTFLEPHLGHRIAGVIGYGVLSKCVAVIDLSSASVELHDPAKYALPRGSWTELDLSDRVPVMTATFEGREGRFMLDTGDHQHLTFYEPAVRRWSLLDNRALKDSKMGGVGGFIKSKSGTIAQFEVGGLTLIDVPANFAIEARGTSARADRAGTIGAGVLKQFQMVVDYGRQRIGLLERRNLSANASP